MRRRIPFLSIQSTRQPAISCWLKGDLLGFHFFIFSFFHCQIHLNGTLPSAHPLPACPPLVTYQPSDTSSIGHEWEINETTLVGGMSHWRALALSASVWAVKALHRLQCPDGRVRRTSWTATRPSLIIENPFDTNCTKSDGLNSRHQTWDKCRETTRREHKHDKNCWGKGVNANVRFSRLDIWSVD